MIDGVDGVFQRSVESRVEGQSEICVESRCNRSKRLRSVLKRKGTEEREVGDIREQ